MISSLQLWSTRKPSRQIRNTLRHSSIVRLRMTSSVDFGDAVQDYTTALRIDPSNPYAMFNRGIVYDRSGDFAKAIEDLRKQSRRYLRMQTFHNRAYSLRKKNRFRDAIEDYACLDRSETLESTFQQRFDLRQDRTVGTCD